MIAELGLRYWQGVLLSRNNPDTKGSISEMQCRVQEKIQGWRTLCFIEAPSSMDRGTRRTDQ